MKETKKEEKKTELKKDEKEEKNVKQTKEEKEKEHAKKKLEKIKIVRKGHKKEENKFKKFLSSYQFLYTAFGILLIAVIILSVMVYKEKNKVKEKKADFVYPIIYEGTQNSMRVDMPGLYKQGKYTIIITNKHNKRINKQKIDYSIKVRKDSSVPITIVKEGDKENLMVDQESTRIEDSLKAKKEEEDKFIITVDEKPKDGDTIYLDIVS